MKLFAGTMTSDVILLIGGPNLAQAEKQRSEASGS